MFKITILMVFCLATVIYGNVTRDQIDKAYKRLESAVNCHNKCTTSADCAVAPVGARACGGPNGYIVYSTQSCNVKRIIAFAKLTEQLERRYNLENPVTSICSLPLAPDAVCDKAKKCAPGQGLPVGVDRDSA